MNGILEGLDTTGKIKVLMAAKGITQVDLSKVTGLSLGTISNRFDPEKKDQWRMDELKKIVDAYQVELTDII